MVMLWFGGQKSSLRRKHLSALSDGCGSQLVVLAAFELGLLLFYSGEIL